METWIEQAVETWRINNRVNLYLLDAIAPDALTSVLPSGRTRTVALTGSGHKLDDGVLYGQWEWSKR